MKITKKSLQDRIEALEEFATYADNMLTELNHALPDPEYDAKCEAAVAGVEASLDRHRERLGLNKPQLKQLTQSVFDGLDEKWRFAAMDFDSEIRAFEGKPFLAMNGTMWDSNLGEEISLGKGVRIIDWYNSLIERDIAKELLEVDLSSELTGSELCKAMLARGDKYVMCGVSDDGEEDTLLDGCYVAVSSIGVWGVFETYDHNWLHATPINNQGEPLTAAEVGF